MTAIEIPLTGKIVQLLMGLLHHQNPHVAPSLGAAFRCLLRRENSLACKRETLSLQPGHGVQSCALGKPRLGPATRMQAQYLVMVQP